MSLSILFCVYRVNNNEEVLINAFPCRPQADALIKGQLSGKLVMKAITDKAQIWKIQARLGRAA